MTVKRKEVFFFDGKTAECVLASDYDALANSLHALSEAARKVTCKRCDDSGFEPWSDFGGAVIEPCPDCADLRKLLEGER